MSEVKAQLAKLKTMNYFVEPKGELKVGPVLGQYFECNGKLSVIAGRFWKDENGRWHKNGRLRSSDREAVNAIFDKLDELEGRGKSEKAPTPSKTKSSLPKLSETWIPTGFEQY